ncbi:hypothetical protein [Paenibacillus koleovorans]|uniref:hypothetical protein n=1 Tax=Paenibacillus koleovorans TaxID=121608 RepID=UPI000FD8698C|nr:hypothetical protein [Paenibacillus koleovorans]
MAYMLRFVQRFQPAQRDAFLTLERQFAALEQAVAEYPKGRRYIPYSGREPVNTLVWECEFPSFAEAQEALAFLEKDERHEELYRQQVGFFLEAYTEMYEVFD